MSDLVSRLRERDLQGFLCKMIETDYADLDDDARALIDTCVSDISEYIDTTTTARKTHLLKNEHQAWCGWGAQSGALIAAQRADVTCRTCRRLAEVV